MNFSQFVLDIVTGEYSWYVVAGAVIIALMIMRFIVKKIKWLIILALFLLVIVLAYTKLFTDTAKYLPDSVEIIEQTEENIDILGR